MQDFADLLFTSSVLTNISIALNTVLCLVDFCSVWFGLVRLDKVGFVLVAHLHCQRCFGCLRVKVGLCSHRVT